MILSFTISTIAIFSGSALQVLASYWHPANKERQKEGSEKTTELDGESLNTH